MDFIGSYYVPASDPFPTPRNAVPPVFHELPPLNTDPDEAQLQLIRNGDFSQLRKLRKMGERRKRTVRFMASVCHDADSLERIALTPKGEQRPPESPPAPAQQQSAEKSQHKPDKDGRMSIFGIKFGKLHTRR